MGRPEIRAGIDKYAPIAKSLTAVNHYLTLCKFRKVYLKTRNRGDHRKSIKVMKVTGVKCAPVTGIAKGIAMAHNSGIETVTDLGDR